MGFRVYTACGLPFGTAVGSFSGSVPFLHGHHYIPVFAICSEHCYDSYRCRWVFSTMAVAFFLFLFLIIEGEQFRRTVTVMMVSIVIDIAML